MALQSAFKPDYRAAAAIAGADVLLYSAGRSGQSPGGRSGARVEL